MITGLNILNAALSVIPHSSVEYQKFISKTVNDFGVTVQSFSEPKRVKAIVESGIVNAIGGNGVELKDYKDMGLDWSKRYITVWLSYVGLEPPADRDGSDRILWDGKTFSVIQVEDRGDYDGWQRCFCVEIKA